MKIISSIDRIEARSYIKDNKMSFSLMGGDLSNALLWSQIGLYENCEKSIEKCFLTIRKNMDYIQEKPLQYSLSTGLTGFAWVLQFLGNNKIVSKSDCKVLDELDNYISKSLYRDKKSVLYDLLQGIIGKGLYFIERCNTDGIKCLKEIIQFLEQTSIRIKGQGITWPDLHTSHYDKTERDELQYYNLGLAHGLPSIIIFLCKLYKMGIEKKKCWTMIRESTNFLLAHKNTEEPIFSYPIKLYPRKGKLIRPVNSKKLAWCYGPLSIAIAMLSAYDILGDQALYEEAYELTINTVHLTETDVNIMSNDSPMDAYLCHGTAGVAYIYFRLYSVFKDPAISKATSYWQKATYKKLEAVHSLKPCGLLDGLTGVCMILNDIESKEDITFQWDKLFLLDQL